MSRPGLTILLHEHDSTFRQIFTEGRPLPEDPFPTGMGYSIGRWDHDVFVVTTTGLTDRSWLDVAGHPHTEALVMTGCGCSPIRSCSSISAPTTKRTGSVTSRRSDPGRVHHLSYCASTRLT